VPRRPRSARCRASTRPTAPDVRPNDFYGPDGFQEMRGGPKQVSKIEAAEDDALAGELWRVSERLTGVRYGVVEVAA